VRERSDSNPYRKGGSLKFLSFVLLAICAGAQEPVPTVPEQVPETKQLPETPEASQEPEYGGPAILSRGEPPSVRTSGELVRIRPFIAANAIYDTGLAAVSLEPTGNLSFDDAYGAQLEFGAQGEHAWRHSALALDYRGGFHHYNRRTYYDGTDHTLTLRYQRRLSRRVSFELDQGGISSQRTMFGGIGGAGASTTTFYDPRFSGLSGDELFDNPTRGLFSTGRLIYQHSFRTSFSAAASGFFIRRRSSALLGAQGYYAIGDVAYRLGRYQTIGFDYNFNHFDFTRQFGSTDIHGVSMNYSARLSRAWEFAMRVGAYRAEVSRVQQVELDPVIAAILGQRTGLETFHTIVYIPHLEGSLTRSFRRATFSVNYTRLIMPGNGVFATSGRDQAGINYNYAGFRRVALHFSLGYTSYSSVGESLGRYRGYTGAAGLSIRLSRSFSLIARTDARRYYIAGAAAAAITPFNRISQRVVLGIAWSPGEYPLSLW
jgi:hypothetical protein